MTRTQQGLIMLSIGVAISVAVSLLAVQNSSDITEGLQVALRWTGRLGFLIFLLPLAAGPLRQLQPGPITAKLVRWRRSAGIAFGGLQSVHLLLILAMLQISKANPFDIATIVVGGAGIALAIAMLLTSFDIPARVLGPRGWKLLHRSGLYVMTFIYFFDFLVAPWEQGFPAVYWPFASLTACALLLRACAAWPRSEQAPDLTSS